MTMSAMVASGQCAGCAALPTALQGLEPAIAGGLKIHGLHRASQLKHLEALRRVQ